MIWLLANWRLVAFSAVILALGVQTGRISLLKSEHAAYRADIERQVAQSKLEAAKERARMAQNATEALDDLQTRLTGLGVRYKRLHDSTNSSAVPTLAESTGIAQTCPGEPDKPNPAVGQMERLEAGIEEILKFGDTEIAKHVELWELGEENSGANVVQ